MLPIYWYLWTDHVKLLLSWGWQRATPGSIYMCVDVKCHGHGHNSAIFTTMGRSGLGYFTLVQKPPEWWWFLECMPQIHFRDFFHVYRLNMIKPWNMFPLTLGFSVAYETVFCCWCSSHFLGVFRDWNLHVENIWNSRLIIYPNLSPISGLLNHIQLSKQIHLYTISIYPIFI